MDNMTVLTKVMFERAIQINSIDHAAKILLQFEHFRTLGDVLRSFSPDGEVKKQLTEGLQLWFPKDKKDSLERKIRNWLGGKTQSVGKQDGYVVSRILNLSLEQTNEFLKKATGEGIHWRNPEDIVWCYSIVHNMTPEETYRLLERSEARIKSSQISQGKPDTYTAEVYEKLQSVLYLEEEALLAFLEEEQSRLGTLHNTAYQLFTSYWNLLKRGYSEEGIEALFKEMNREEKQKAKIPVDGDIGPHRSEQITARDILETYLYRKLVPVQERGKSKTADVFSAIQRNIRQNWPDESSLSKMEARKQDISRKTLILLFLATDGTDSDFSEYDDEADSADEMFLSIYTRLNLMLSDCGFPQLDPRNPFDWIILFCIATGDLCDTDARLQEILLQMYPPVT